MTSKKCPICFKDADPECKEDPAVKISEHRRVTLCRCSRERGDGFVTWRFRNTADALIHERCYNTYTHHRNVQQYCERHNQLGLQPQEEQLLAQENVEEALTAFAFEDLCIFCRTLASQEFEKAESKNKDPKKRNVVKRLSSTKTIDTIKEFCKSGKAVKYSNVQNVLKIIDLNVHQPRYHAKCMNIFYNAYKTKFSDPMYQKVLDYVMQFLKENTEEPQYSFDEILENYDGEIPAYSRIASYVSTHHGNEILVAVKNRKHYLCQWGIGYKTLLNLWEQTKKSSNEADKKRFLKTAADILVDEIRSTVYEKDSYPTPQTFLQTVETSVPKDLLTFLNQVICKNKKKPEEYKGTVLSIAHAIIAAVRPGSFISPLQVVLAFVLNKRYASKDLINLGYKLGFLSSYKESQIFENSIVLHKKNAQMGLRFCQYVFDNADHNVNTLDGYKTFHVMGGIQIVTPASDAVDSIEDSVIQRKPRIDIQDQQKYFTSIPLLTFERSPQSTNVEPAKFESLQYKTIDDFDFSLLETDFLWLYGKSIGHEKVKGWNGFMEHMAEEEVYDKSRIIFLPIIDAAASNYNTIYSALKYAANKSKELGLDHCIVTFDQPLYWKARDIIESSSDPDIQKIILRLGGFHLLASFMGSIGYFMDGSGLQELYSAVYAMGSTDHIMNGHKYDRAVRAHILTQAALFKIISSSIKFDDAEKQLLQNLLNVFEQENICNRLEQDDFKTISKKFHVRLKELETESPTGRLWVQYFHLVTLLKQFIESERTGKWFLQLEIIQKMIPFFHAAGHFLYAKSAHAYIQDMKRLRLQRDDYDLFVKKGYFTVRRTDAFRRGVWTDMTIEQTLMRSMHSAGGLTRGRGTSPIVVARWLHTMPVYFEFSEELRSLLDMQFRTSSEQHVDWTEARSTKDDIVIKKFVDWLKIHDPFKSGNHLINISNDMKAKESVSCHYALDRGLKSLNNIIRNECTIKKVTFTRANIVVNLKLSSKITVSKDVSKALSPTLIFQRISFLKEKPNDLRDYLSHELAATALTLFDEVGMRKTDKAKLYDYFQPIDSSFDFQRCIHVIDGGFLLKRVVWIRDSTYQDIYQQYYNYVDKHYHNSVIIFDGYPDDPKSKHTKSAERIRRNKKKACQDYIVQSDFKPLVSQEAFLSNENNKRELINFLMMSFTADNVTVHQAVEDADALTVHTAVELSNDDNYDTVKIVGEDIDLLVILTQLQAANVYFLKPSIGQVEEKIFDRNSFIYPQIAKYIAFIHAFSGCDSTSAFYKKGKKRLLNLFLSSNIIGKICDAFYVKENYDKFICYGGHKIIQMMYGANIDVEEMHMNDFRYHMYNILTKNNKFQLEKLPPTQGAANEHCYRVYYQIQEWLQQHENLKVEEWGWQKTENGLMPIVTRDPLVPVSVQKIVSCQCKKGCTGRCTCKKNGKFCTDACKYCRGINCCNIERVDISVDGDDEIDDLHTQQLDDNAGAEDVSDDESQYVNGAVQLQSDESDVDEDDPAHASYDDYTDSSTDNESASQTLPLALKDITFQQNVQQLYDDSEDEAENQYEPKRKRSKKNISV